MPVGEAEQVEEKQWVEELVVLVLGVEEQVDEELLVEGVLTPGLTYWTALGL